MAYFQEEEYQDQKVNLGTWRTIFRYALGYKKHILFLMTAMVINGVMDVILPMFNSFAIDNFIMKQQTAGLWLFAIAYCICQMTNAVCVFTFCAQAGHIENGMSHDIRKDAFKRLQELSFSYYDKTPVGYIMARMTSDAQRLA